MLKQGIFSVTSENFDELALNVFRFQYANNEIYRLFCEGLKRHPENVFSIGSIPFLPVEFFKTQPVYASGNEPEIVFTSSGTSGQITSSHAVADLDLYRNSFLNAFRFFYGDPGEWTILALLPSYLEREGSSLVYMADTLIRESKNAGSGFYLHNYAELSQKLQQLNQEKKKVLLLGVTYALLDLAEQFPQPLEHITIMETGGMKGKRREMIREELHSVLKNAFSVRQIHSEYGMTELLSQAYSDGDGIFHCPPWMKIIVREMNDPFSLAQNGKTGGVNIIDLANLYSCSFLATSDLGKICDNDGFEILGRFDNSDVRGCNLMVE